MSIQMLALLALVPITGSNRPVVVQNTPNVVTAISREQLERLPTGHDLETLVKQIRCDPSSIPTVVPSPIGLRRTRYQVPGLACVRPDDIRMVDIYRLHNAARTEVGAAPFVWDPQLAYAARSYAQTLASTGQLIHSPRQTRQFARENLLRAPVGWNARRMIGYWTVERQYFVPGVFPNVSRTGNWQDVSHYTQIIWPTTNRIGCGLQYGVGFNWLICRYSPPGNQDGKRVIPPPPPPPPPPSPPP